MGFRARGSPAKPYLIELVVKEGVALGESFHLCRLKNYENSKPQPEKKTFKSRSVALVATSESLLSLFWHIEN